MWWCKFQLHMGDCGRTKYKVTTEDYFVFKKVKAEITGYPATLSGVELIENKVPCACGK